MTTTTIEHTITVTRNETIRAWGFACSCGYKRNLFRFREDAEHEGERHRNRPQLARAEDIAERLRTGKLTAEEARLIGVALQHAAWINDVPATIPVAAECALDNLVELVRGEAS